MRDVWLDVGHESVKSAKIQVRQDYGPELYLWTGQGVEGPGNGYTSPVISLPYGYSASIVTITCLIQPYNGDREMYSQVFPDTLWVKDDDVRVALRKLSVSSADLDNFEQQDWSLARVRETEKYFQEFARTGRQ